MPVMAVSMLESLVAARTALLACPGFTMTTPAVENLTAQIEKNSGVQAKSWVLKVAEIGKLIQTKVARVASKAEGEASYDAGKLKHDLHAIIEMLKAVETSAVEHGVE
jgi:hypothetical protein